MPEPILMHIMAPEPISTAYFMNPSHQFVCTFISHAFARQRLGNKSYRGKEYTRNNRRIVEGVVYVRSRRIKGKYVGVLISLWLFLFAALPEEFFLDVLKKLEQRSH
jgi:hypothetical protein